MVSDIVPFPCDNDLKIFTLNKLFNYFFNTLNTSLKLPNALSKFSAISSANTSGSGRLSKSASDLSFSQVMYKDVGVEELFIASAIPAKVFFIIVTLPVEKNDMNSLNKYVEVKTDLAGEVPVFKGTRVTVKTLFDYLQEESLEEFLLGFPTVTREQAEGVIEMAAEKFLSGIAE